MVKRATMEMMMMARYPLGRRLVSFNSRGVSSPHPPFLYTCGGGHDQNNDDDDDVRNRLDDNHHHSWLMVGSKYLRH